MTSVFREQVSVAVANLLSEQPLLGAMLFRMRILESFDHETAAVAFNDECRFELHINPIFFGLLSFGLRKEILLHEALHLSFDHLPRFLEWAKRYPKMSDEHLLELWNLAADAAINSHPKIKLLLSEGCISPRKDADGKFTLPPLPADKKRPGISIALLNKKFSLGLSASDSAETIADALVAAYPENRKKINDLKTVDGHEGLRSGEKFEAARQKLLREASTDAAVHGGIKEELGKKVAPAKVAWQTQMMNFLSKKGGQGSRYTLDFNRPSRKWMVQKMLCKGQDYPPISPALKKQPLPRVLFAIDVSGSIMNKLISEVIFPEIGEVGRLASVDLMQWSDAVHSLEKFDEEKPLFRTGTGGTNPNCIFEYLQKKGLDREYAAIVICSDMDFPVRPSAPFAMAQTVLWLDCAESGFERPSFGDYIVIR